MKDGTCPKCESTEVYEGPEGFVPAGLLNLNISFGSNARLHVLVCAHCGYAELYLPDRSKLREIAKEWKRVH